MHILHVVGARPNFMKAAPVLRALAAHPRIRQTLVHTGQHYDAAMSEVFFQQLEMPQPDYNLEVGSGSHAQQAAAVMLAFEPVLLDRQPELVLVYGDVNSTLAAALVCSKLNVRVGHVEAGLRSRDRSMPEEINRILTDQLSDLLFTPSPDGDENLLREGIDAHKIHLVGNVMIDTLVRLLPRSEAHFNDKLLDDAHVNDPHANDPHAQDPRPNDAYFPTGTLSPYALVTLHRASNVDDLPWLRELLAVLSDLSGHLNIIFPVHPRTRQRLQQLTPDVLTSTPQTSAQVRLLDPLPYLEFLALQRRAALVITDSGGIQEETTFLGIPCLTVRENTERPITLTQGTNQLVGRDLRRLRAAAAEILARTPSPPSTPTPVNHRVPLWDGHAADRIAEIIARSAGSK